jgi:hypothetical protein
MAQNVEPLGLGNGQRTYFGGCECRMVRFTVELDLRERDARTKSVWEHSTSPASFRLIAGQQSVIGYQFAAEDAHHFFCTGCSCRVFSHWSPEGTASYYSLDVKSLYGRELLPLGLLTVRLPAAGDARR